MAPKSKLTENTQATIVRSLRAGNYVETAAAAAGISKSTLYDWLRRGARAKSGAHKEFADAVANAQAEGEQSMVAIIAAAAGNQWQAAAWHLERKFPDKWGRRQRIEHGVSDDVKVVFSLPPNGREIEPSSED